MRWGSIDTWQISDIVILLITLALASNFVMLLAAAVCGGLKKRLSAEKMDRLLKGVVLYLLLAQPALVGIVLYKSQFPKKTAVFGEHMKYLYHIQHVSFGMIQENPWVFAVFSAALLIWLAGALWLGGRRFLKLRRLLTLIEQSATYAYSFQAETSKRGPKEIPVCVSPIAMTPFIRGWRNPKIILPKLEADDLETTLILQHEAIHFVRADYIYRNLFFILCSLFWFNPVVAYMADYFIEVNEMACDEMVLSKHEKRVKPVYAELLYRMTMEETPGMRYVAHFTGSGKHILERRIENMRRERRKGEKVVFTAAVLSAVLLCPAVSWGASMGVSYGQNAIARVIRDRNSTLDQSEQLHYTEFEGVYRETSQSRTVYIDPRGRETVEETIDAYGSITGDVGYMDKGVKVHVYLEGGSSDRFKVGLAMGDSQKYVYSKNGIVDYTFTTSASGEYDLVIENLGGTTITVEGIVYTK